MKNIATALICLFIVVLFVSPCFGVTSEKLKPLKKFEGGTLYGAGPVKVLELKGNYRQMGRQYGHLLRDDLQKLYGIAITDNYMGRMKFTHERLKTIAYSFYELYPLRYREIFKGMAETSGMTLEQVVLLNGLEFYPKINHLQFNCSGLAVWGDYTNDRGVVFGRNNDDSEFFRDFASFLTVTVLKPGDGSNPTAIVNYAGVIYAANGLNSRGVFLELNSGPWEGFYLTRPSIFVTLMTLLQDLPSLEILDPALMSVRPNISSIITVADATKAYSFECSCRESKRREGDSDGMIVAANHFVSPDWGLSQINDDRTGQTMKRRDNLLTLGRKFKGKFDAAKMMEVFDTVIDEGGATSPDETIYQIVAIPGRLEMWLKAPGVFDWTKVDLSGLLTD